MNIRSPLPEDTPAIAALSAQLGYPVSPGEVSVYYADLTRLSDHLILVAEAEDAQVVGWLHAFVSRRLFVPPFAELGGLVVRDSHRRRGVASGLLLRAEGWAAEIGCHVFRIRTNTQRIESAPFYRHRGYVLSKTQYVFEKILTLDQHT